ncbi:hypothetical protein [Actinocorallia longicatena]|uniref:Galactose oxidase-like protein n=1 Tax=Actinocorallia longicatena TaxID=111803 RepID=A0ABP6QHF2_9ACTN
MRRIPPLLALLVLPAGCSSLDGGAPPPSSPPPSAADHAPGTSWTIARSPVPSRVGHIAAWTGTEMVVWGGIGEGARTGPTRFGVPLTDGAAYTPDTDTWRKIAPSPLTARSLPAAVWTGRTVFVWGGSGVPGETRPPVADGAEYDPAADAWTPLPKAPSGPRGTPVAVWTGTEVLLWSGTLDGDRRSADGLAYTPATRTWRKIPPAPLAAFWDADALWTGRDLIVLARSESWTGSRAVSYSPETNTWRRLPAPPSTGHGFALPVWTGTRLLLPGLNAESPRGLSYDPSARRWTWIPASKPVHAEGTPVLTPKGVLTWSGSRHAALYDPAANRWRRLALPAAPYREFPTTVWTGRDLLLWGGSTCPPGAACASLTVAPAGTALRP